MAKAKGMTRLEAVRDVLPVLAEATKRGVTVTRKSLLAQFFPNVKNVETPFGGIFSQDQMKTRGIRKHGSSNTTTYDLTPAGLAAVESVAIVETPGKQRAKKMPAQVQVKAASPVVKKAVVLLSSKEGKRLLKVHKTIERNPALGREKKRLAQSELGCLRCAVCNFDFSRRYGPHGDGFIECHHTKPLSDRLEEEETLLEDLELVCANCHRMLHRGSRMLLIAELRAMLLPTQ